MRGNSSTLRGRKLCLTIGMVMPNTSSSWNASVPISEVATWPVMTTIGTESSIASAMPVTRLDAPGPEVRSEEHTSELQSLMRISYAVYCLKKKKLKVINH